MKLEKKSKSTAFVALKISLEAVIRHVLQNILAYIKLMTISTNGFSTLDQR
jgi:hypothetical protein